MNSLKRSWKLPPSRLKEDINSTRTYFTGPRRIEGLFISEKTRPTGVDLNFRENITREEGDSPFSLLLLTEQKEMSAASEGPASVRKAGGAAGAPAEQGCRAAGRAGEFLCL